MDLSIPGEMPRLGAAASKAPAFSCSDTGVAHEVLLEASQNLPGHGLVAGAILSRLTRRGTPWLGWVCRQGTITAMAEGHKAKGWLVYFQVWLPLTAWSPLLWLGLTL